MNTRRNLLYFTSLGMILASCTSQPKTQKKLNKSQVPSVAPVEKSKISPEEPKKPEVSHIGNYDFFTTNIGNSAKKDNTISHGSIVSATPPGYQVTKNYFPAVAQNFRQRFIIVHYTALNNDKSISVLTQQSVSAHYLVNDIDDKEIYQIVDENKRAYHAGISHWRGFEQLNDTSIGIEIVNPGYTAANGQKYFVDFPDHQVKKIAALIKDIANRYEVAPIYILAHSDIAPTRKSDPGPTFPWKKLYDQYQIGMWYDESTKLNFVTSINPEQYLLESTTPQFLFKIQTMLKDFGYGIQPSGTYDDTTKKTIEAFQYHFRPEKCDGNMDIETYAILQALLQKYPK